MISATSTATNAIHQNLASFHEAAARISDPDQVADASDIVAMKQAELAVQVNLAVLGRSQAMAEHVIDILT